jgi:MerR family mercuric resistance operon transcriptional regulator
MEMTGITIGKVANQAHVNIDTVRYYERRGLIERPLKRDSGFRYYPDNTIQRIRFIKRAQGLGFSLREIKDLLKLRVTPGSKCADIRDKAESKIAEITEKIKALGSMKKTLVKLTAT